MRFLLQFMHQSISHSVVFVCAERHLYTWTTEIQQKYLIFKGIFIYFLVFGLSSSTVLFSKVWCSRQYVSEIIDWATLCFQSFLLSLSPCYQSFGSLLALLLMHKPTALQRDSLQSAARFISGLN